MKRVDLVKHLRQHGCRFDREGGNHTIYKNPANGKWSAIGRHRQIPDYTARRICRQLEIPEPD